MVVKVGEYYVCEICGFYRNDDESKVRKHELLHRETEPIVVHKKEIERVSNEIKTIEKDIEVQTSELKELRGRVSELEKTVSELSKPAETATEEG